MKIQVAGYVVLTFILASTIPTDTDGRRIRLLTVPHFNQTVLVNLKTLKCSKVQFCTSLVSSSPSVPHPMDTGDTPMAAESEETINYMEEDKDDYRGG